MNGKNTEIIRKIFFYLLVWLLSVVVITNFHSVQNGFFNTWLFGKRGNFAQLCRASHSPYADGTMLCYYTKKFLKGQIASLILPEKEFREKIIGKFNPSLSSLFVYPAKVVYQKYNYDLSETEKNYLVRYKKSILDGKENRYWFIDNKAANLAGKNYAVFKFHNNIFVLPFDFRAQIFLKKNR